MRLARKRLGDLARGLLGREDERHAASEDPLEHRPDDRIVRAAEDDGVDVGLLSGSATSRTASTVSSPNGSAPSISGTSVGQATEVTSTPASSAPDQLVVATARDGRLRSRAGRPGGCGSRARPRAPRAESTPTTGTESERWRSGSAAAVAELQATTTSFTPATLEEVPDLEREAPNLVERPRPVRQARVVTEVDDVLVPAA